MKLYIAEYYNNAYLGKPIDIELLTKNDVTLYDLNQIYQDFNETPTYTDLISLDSYGRCMIKAIHEEKKLIFLIDPLHPSSKGVMRQILLNKIV